MSEQSVEFEPTHVVEVYIRDGKVHYRQQIRTEGGKKKALTRLSPFEFNKLINLRIQRRTFALYIGAFSLVVLVFGISRAGQIQILAGIVGLLMTLVVNKLESNARTTVLNYHLDHASRVRFSRLKKALAAVSASDGAWIVLDERENLDWKRQAGASHLIKRHSIKAGELPTPFLISNIRAFGILPVDDTELYFFPDRIFIYRKKIYFN